MSLTNPNSHVTNDDLSFLLANVVEKEAELREDDIREAVSNKVDKEEGKGLSSNDFTDEYKNKINISITTDASQVLTDAEKEIVRNKIGAGENDFSGDYNDLTNKPTLGTAAATDIDDYATSAQGTKADSSVQEIKINGTIQTKDADGSIDLPAYPTTLPASDVSEWAKAENKPSYNASEVGAIATTEKGSSNGVAELDENGKVPAAQLPSYVDDVTEYDEASDFPWPGESGKIYINKADGRSYRWSGTQYSAIKGDLALGETASTAYAGNKGLKNATDIQTIQTQIGNHTLSEDVPEGAKFTDTTYDTFDGTNEGLVPTPTDADAGKFLKSDGTWGEGGTTDPTMSLAEFNQKVKSGELKPGDKVDIYDENTDVEVSSDEVSHTTDDGKETTVKDELNEINGALSDLDTKVDDCFTSVSNGKALVASAITDKGVETAEDATFAVLANHISLIETGGINSLILPTNPVISLISDNQSLNIKWEQPESEVEIEKYNIYASIDEPSKLTDMEYKGSTSELSYRLTGLINKQKYYIGIQAVSVEGYENASMWEIKDEIPSAVRFVCVGYGNNTGKSYYSTDGLTWIEMTGLASTGSSYQAVAYGNGRFVCVGSNGKSCYSTDGVSWNTMSGLPSGYFYGVTYGNGRFVCVGGSNAYAYYSTDGLTWTKMTGLSNLTYKAVAYGNGRFVCVGYDSNGGIAYYSTDGASWTKMTIPSTSQYYGVAYGNGRFVCVGSNGKSYYSIDGLTWTEMTGLRSAVFSGVTYGDGRFVCVGLNNSYYSTDGVSWKGMTGLSSTDTLYAVAYGNGRFVCVGSNTSSGGTAYYSTNGTSWTKMTGLATSISYNGVTSNRELIQ